MSHDIPLRQRVRAQTESTYRSAILDAAERVFSQQGFHEARMADIAQAAGVSVGTLYNYFESKDLVFSSLVKERREELQATLRAAAKEPHEAPALHLVAALLGHIEEKSALILLLTQLGAVTENDVRRVAGPDAEAGYRQYLELLSETLAASAKSGELRNDIEPRRLASALAGAVNAAVFDWLQEGRPAGLRERATEIYSLFVLGAQSR